MALRLRRGTDAQRLTLDGVSIPVPAEGELIYTTDTKKLFVGDGATVGGIAVDVANSSLSIDALSDVDITSVAPTAGQSLVWNNSASEFQPGDPTVLSNKSINSLQDVDLISNAPVSGQTLKWDGTKFVPANDDASGSLVPGSTHVINIEGDVSGSVFGDDSSLIVDGTDGQVVATTLNTNAIKASTDTGEIVIRNNFRTPVQVVATTDGTQNGFPYSEFLNVKGSVDAPQSLAAGDIVGGFKITGYDLAAERGKVGALFYTELEADAVITDEFPKASGQLIIAAGGNNFNTFKFGTGGDFTSPGAITPGIYADATARDAAITAPTAGMMVFVTDVTKFQGYTGSTWADLN
jgi:hypothetical protein